MPINWCPSCKIGLANEEVVDGSCERCGHGVETRVKNQWMLKITEYAERLIEDLDEVDYIERVKIQQRNWIGRSEGADVSFAIKDTAESLTVFTTRPDTLFGATYMVISPEHPILEKLQDRIANLEVIKAYQAEARKKTEFERAELNHEKTGVRIEGLAALNPVNSEEITIWVSDYVLMSYGTGAIMAVPGHDERDWEFAKTFDLPIIEVVAGGDVTQEAYTQTETGTMVNSGFLNGLDVDSAKKKITAWLEEKGLGVPKVNYKLRDWVFSRQRYWGEPIPLVHCSDCGWVAIPEEELPLRLPQVENYEPTDTGESPLAKMRDWVETTCPTCGGYAERETDTMPQWAGSSWYFLRYTDPHNDQALASRENLDYWMAVDWYNGGMEHTTLHLLYSRFWHKFLYDIGVVPGTEPYKKRTSHGMILGENNEKMSKSRGNVVNPDDVVKEYGADTLRMYEMFIGDFEKSVPWSTDGVRGCKRFLDRVWKLKDTVKAGSAYSEALEAKMHQTIKKVSHDYESLKFNTAIAALMTLFNEVNQLGTINEAEMKTFLILLNPVAPHITEELWQVLGFEGMLHEQSWPSYDEEKTIAQTIAIGVQVNGKVRGDITVNLNDSQEAAREKAMANDNIQRAIAGKTIVKEIYVPGRIYNIVVK
jgi:leucyl-tRNA synthetase